MSDRLARIVAGLGLRPDDDVLEIGCGHGVAATAICDELTRGTGHYVGIDRSPRMIAAAARRNAAHVHSGRATFLVMQLEELGLGARRFDVVLAVRVGRFHREPERAHALVTPWLGPGGRVHAVFDEPPAAGPGGRSRIRPRGGR